MFELTTTDEIDRLFEVVYRSKITNIYRSKFGNGAKTNFEGKLMLLHDLMNVIFYFIFSHKILIKTTMVYTVSI